MTPHQFRVLAKCDDGTWAVQDSVDLDDMIRVLALAETFSRYARNVKTMVTKHFLMKAARFKCDRECPHDAGTAGGVEADAGDQVGPADSIDLQVSELVRTTIEEMNAKLLSIGICAKIDVVTIPVPRG
jgi:hypothetical protein